jgi:hypothetical protein
LVIGFLNNASRIVLKAAMSPAKAGDVALDELTDRNAMQTSARIVRETLGYSENVFVALTYRYQRSTLVAGVLLPGANYACAVNRRRVVIAKAFECHLLHPRQFFAAEAVGRRQIAPLVSENAHQRYVERGELVRLPFLMALLEKRAEKCG